MAPRKADGLVPIIDISAPKESEMAALDAACSNHGFFFIRGHGLDGLIEKTFSAGTDFFNSSCENRRAIMRDEENPMGWFDRELTKGMRDHKEIFDYTAPDEPLGLVRNKWPAEPHHFRKTLTEFHEAFSALANRTVALVLQGLGVDADTAGSLKGDETISPVRLNKYLIDDPVPEEERAFLPPLGNGALGAHTDPGVLTLLVQDSVGGLQTRAASGDWVDVVPVAGSIVVNLGDTMQVWTNDRYRAALHRVQPMKKADRMSIPYFLHPPREMMVAPIDHTSAGKPLYRPFIWGDFIAARDADNFEDIGKADAQISDYRIT